MTDSPNLVLPYIAGSQAQKHVTHNEAIRLLDGMVQLSILSRIIATPPGSPTDGSRYIVASGATGVWTGWDLNVAFWVDGAWMRLIPRVGWIAYSVADTAFYSWNGSAWVVLSSGGGSTTLTGDVTGSGTGTIALTIAAGAVTLAKQATLAANRIIGNNTGSAATPLALTAAQVKTLLAVSLTSDVTGVLQAAQEPAHTGDVTNTAGSLALTIATGAVTLAKQATLAANSIIGNNTGSAATPLALTAAQVKTLLAISSADVSGLASVATAGTFASLTGIPTSIAGYGLTDAVPNTGTKTIAGQTTFTGNVIIPDGSFFLQDDLDATRQLKLQLSAITTGTIRTWTVPDLTGEVLLANGAQTINGAKTFTGTLTVDDSTLWITDNLDTTKILRLQLAGLTTATTRILTIPDATGTVMLTSTVLAAAQAPVFTGDVTSPGGSLALTIAAGAVTLAKQATLAANSIIGNNTGSAATPIALTGTQTTAMLDAFTSSLKGLAPASGGGTANFLRADGTWAAPAGGGGGLTFSQVFAISSLRI